MKRRTLLLIVGVVIVVVAASTSMFLLAPQSREKSFTLVAYDFGYDGYRGGPKIVVKEGDVVKITLTNKGGVEHELMILTREELDEFIEHWEKGEKHTHPEPVFKGAEIEEVEPGETKTTTFVADKAGEYVYVCLVEEPELHAKLGMVGEFVVEPR